jgi:superfamily I DNA/RNA helicase
LVCAFNKSIADALKVRLADTGCDILTLHSLGLRSVTAAHGRREVDSRYTGKLVMNEIFDRDVRAACVKLIGIAKGSLLQEWDDLDEALDTQGIDVEPRSRNAVIATAMKVLRKCEAATKGPIDFDDMIWLPAAQGLSVPKYEFVFVDETQDLNPAQLWLTRAACAPGGRIVAVGDRRQAIYGFRGADREAIPRMIRELQATVMPLSITYRCPKAVVREANKFVPTLQAAPGAPEGTVRHVSESELRLGAAPGDMVLSRINAPLVSLALAWLAEGRRCRIQGRNIGEGLVKLIGALGKRGGGTVPELLRALGKWHQLERDRLVAAERDTQEADDKAACIEALCEGHRLVSDVKAAAEKLFADDGEPGILLSSTHRAKGLEAARVWVLWDTYRPSGKASNEEERNLCYVAVTRSKGELNYVHSASEGEGN